MSITYNKRMGALNYRARGPMLLVVLFVGAFVALFKACWQLLALTVKGAVWFYGVMAIGLIALVRKARSRQ